MFPHMLWDLGASVHHICRGDFERHLSDISVSGPLLDGDSAMSGQHDVVLVSPLALRDSRGVVGLATVLQQQPQSEMPLQASANYTMGPLQVGCSFRVEPPTTFLYVLVSVLVYAFCFQVPYWIPYSLMESQPLGFAPLQLLELTGGRHMCNLMMVIGPYQECTEWLLPPVLQVGGAFCYSIRCPLGIPIYGRAYSLGGLAEPSDPPAFPTWWEGIFFSRCGSNQ